MAVPVLELDNFRVICTRRSKMATSRADPATLDLARTLQPEKLKNVAALIDLDIQNQILKSEGLLKDHDPFQSGFQVAVLTILTA
jgi:hypothetical protein